ncbi:hypothetical protein QYF36_005919 [Acer negundo]|nr:hypothetical protein QYF36_005919 [Acer negundo]
MLEAIRASQMSYKQTLNGCMEASAHRFLRLEASMRRTKVHIGTIMEAMQGQESEEFPIPPKLEEANTIPWSAKNVEHDFIHYFVNDSSSIAGEEVGKEEIIDKVKEPKPYVTPITFPCCLRKNKWNTTVGDKYFQDLIAYKRKFEALEFG